MVGSKCKIIITQAAQTKLKTTPTDNGFGCEHNTGLLRNKFLTAYMRGISTTKNREIQINIYNVGDDAVGYADWIKLVPYKEAAVTQKMTAADYVSGNATIKVWKCTNKNVQDNSPVPDRYLPSSCK